MKRIAPLLTLVLLACKSEHSDPPARHTSLAARVAGATLSAPQSDVDRCNQVMQSSVVVPPCASGAGVILAVYGYPDESGNMTTLPAGSARCFCVGADTGLFAMAPLPDSDDAGQDGGS